MKSTMGKVHQIGCSIVLLCLLFANQALYAQEGLSYGVKAGATVSYFSNEQPHTGVKIGYTGGLFTSYPVNEKLSVQVELNYLQQGGSYMRYFDESVAPVEGILFSSSMRNSNITLHNLEIPVLAQFSPLDLEGFAPKFYVGPSYALTLAAWDNYTRTGTLKGQNIIGTVSNKENVTSEFRKGQFGVNAGFMVEVPVGESALQVDVRYRYGITTAKESFSHVYLNNTGSDIRTNTVSVTLGYKL